MSNDLQDSVLLSTFYSGKKRLRLYLHKGQIVWDREKPPYAQHSVPIENVIAVQYSKLPDSSSAPNNEVQYDPNRFIIHYAERSEKSTWKYCNLKLGHSDPLQVSSWVKTLQNHLQSFSHRPKRLLLFVNPYGGKKKALKVFNKFGKPLFQLAGVDVNVIVSQRQNQIRDIVINHNLDMFDSIGCVGGDGTVAELFNGLVIRECKLKGINPDDMSQDLPKPSLSVGIIPGGSTDTIAYCLHGTIDVTTAVLHIIFGDPLGLDLVTVYDESKLLNIYASVLSYGYLGDIAHHSERYRWMGPLRYEYCGFKRLISNKGYKGEIAMLMEKSEEQASKCYEKCDTCEVKRAETDESKNEDHWKVVDGKFFMVSGANISCACERSPNGIAPFGHLGDGNMHLLLVRHTSVVNNLRLLLRFSKSDSKTDDFGFVETFKVKEFCFRAQEHQSRWNCDGEVQYETDVRAKVRCQLLTVYGRGNQKPKENKAITCCGMC